MVYVQLLSSFWKSGILFHDKLATNESFKWPFLIDNISSILSQFVAGRIKHVLCDSREKESQKLIFSGLCPCACSLCFFYFASFTIINISHDYNYMLSHVRLSSKYQNLAVVLGTPDTSSLTTFQTES